MARLYCIRHGETVYNAEGRIQGQLDVPLSDVGRRQSAAIVRAFAGVRLACVYASPLRRAAETARPLAEAQGVELRFDDRLKELNAGVFQDLLPAEMEIRYPTETARWRAHDPDFEIPGGESRRRLRERGTDVLGELLRSGPAEAAVVAHGGLLCAALKGLLGIDIGRSPFQLFNASISVLEFDGQARLVTLNGTEHLRDADGRLSTRRGDL